MAMGVWRYRVAKDKGKLRFVFARYDTTDMYARRGLIAGIVNEGDSINDLRILAQMLIRALDEPVIGMAEFEDEPHDDDDDDDEWAECME